MSTTGLPKRASQPLTSLARRAPTWLVVLVALTAIGTIAYWDSFAAPFQFDDLPNIVDNPSVHMVDLDRAALHRAAFENPNNRPLANLTFAFNYYFSGTRVFSYHLVNFLVHVLSSLLAFLLACKILERAVPRMAQRARNRAAIGTALLFLCHPIQTQAVTYVVQRMASLGALFAFASVLLYLHGRERTGWRRWGRLAGAVVAFVAALACKQNYLVLPALVAALELLLYDDGWDWLRRNAALAAGVGVTVAGGGIYWLHQNWPSLMSSYGSRDFTLGERLLTQARVLFHYASLLAAPLPSRLQVEYDYPTSHSLFDPLTTFVAIVALCALLALAVWSWRRQRLVALAIVWYLGALSVESSVLPLVMVYEHRLYFPAFGPLLLVAFAAEHYLGRVRFRAWSAIAPIAVLLCVFTIQRNRDWADPERLYRQTVERAPGNTRAQLNLGWSCYRKGDLECAEAAFQAVLELDPNDVGALNNLGNVAVARGELADAERYYRRVLEIEPGILAAMQGLTRVLTQQQRFDEAERVALEFVQTHAADPRGHVVLGTLDAQRGRYGEALAHFSHALQLDPGSAEAYHFRGRTYAQQGRCDLALADLEQSLRIEERPDTRVILADCLKQLGRAEEAIAAYEAVLRAHPELVGVNYGLGNLYAERSELDRAREYYLKEIEIAPHSQAYNNLGNIELERGNVDGARSYYLRALEIDPSNSAARGNLARLGG